MAYKYQMEEYTPTAADRAWMVEQKAAWTAAVAQYEVDKANVWFSTTTAPGSDYPDRYYFAGEEYAYSGETPRWAAYTNVNDPTRKRLIKPDFSVFNPTEFANETMTGK